MDELDTLENEIKIGARNSGTDASRLQQAHDLLVANGATCATVPEVTESPIKSEDDTLITFGDSVKAVQLDSGDVKLSGYLVRFGDAKSTDLTGDYFTADTDFGKRDTSDGWFNHRMPVEFKGKRIAYTDQLPDVKLTKDSVGVFAEIIIGARNEYEKAISRAGLAGLLGWSSGTANHLVDRKQVGNAQEIIKWPLGLDASLTPTPAEPRNGAIALKSYQPTTLEIEATPQAAQENRDEAQTLTAEADQTKSHDEGETMSEELEAIKTLTEKVNALETVIKNAPPVQTVPAATHVEVVTDPADVPFKSIRDNCAAIKSFELSKGRTIHPRLTNPVMFEGDIKAVVGASEGIPADGGFLLDPTLTSEFLAPTHEVGQFSQQARRLPVSSNSNYGWINGVDETDRATGSRWGGIRGYRMAEGDTKTASKPKFRRINWELKKYAVLVYGTDELLQDAAMFSTVVRQGVSEELVFMLNDDIMNGAGAAGPLGFMQSPALVTVAKETNQAADTIVYANLVKMWARLMPRSKTRAAWFVNSDTMPQLDSLALPAGTGALEPRFVSYGPEGIMRIKGKPVYETEFNATVGDLGDIVLADMSEYLMWEKAGIQEAQSIHVEFLTDQTIFRFVYRCDGQTARASAVTPYKGSNTQSPFVALAERT